LITVDLAQPRDVDQLRSLFSEYAAWIDFSSEELEKEITNIPREYAPPDGCVLLAKAEENAVGCVSIRRISEGVCEMKRLYVKPAFREKGIGRKLSESVIGEARSRGYRIMKLNMLPSMREARRLYESLGFKRTAAYEPNPVRGAMFMLLDLTVSP